MKHLLLTTIAAVVLVGCGDPDGALGKAVSQGNIEAAKQAIADGADVNAKDKHGLTPLHYATANGRKPRHKEIVELLIANGAAVNAMSNSGWTPLHVAAKNGHKEIAELLIAKSANVNAKNDFGRTPLDLATVLRRDAETADLLRKHGGKTGAELKAEGK
jgi:ankyrin repeat protein